MQCLIVLILMRFAIFNDNDDYSVAINHLLNKIHAICMILAPKNKIKEYEADDAVKYLRYRYVSHEICINVCNPFDRKNRQTVSHPGSGKYITWGVTKTEYIG